MGFIGLPKGSNFSCNVEQSREVSRKALNMKSTYNYNYPVLAKIVDLYSKKNKDDLKNIHILVCQHLLEPQAKMFELLVDFGIPKETIQICY